MTLRPRGLAALAALALATGCYEHSGTERVIDLRARTASIALTDLRSDGDDPASDIRSAAGALLFDTAVESRYPQASLTHKDFRVRGEALDFVAELSFEQPASVGVMAWDRGGHRICPSEPGMIISQSNADSRDAAGCVMWKRRATVLRVIEIRTTPRTGVPMVSAFQDWDRAGRPPPDEAPADVTAPAAPQG